MAIHGPSIPVPAVQPRFVRGGNAPARVLTRPRLSPLVGVNPAVEPLLPLALLPSLTAAFSRRRAIFGPVSVNVDSDDLMGGRGR